MHRLTFDAALKYGDVDGHTTIYGLAEPDNRVVYVGRTVALRSRLNKHLRMEEDSPKKNRWLAELLARGIRPDVVILEVVPTDEWREAERRWIALFGGVALHNATDGGDVWCVPVGARLSDEHKRKIGDANRGRKHSEESRRRMAEAHKGYVPTAETRAKLSEAGKGRPVSAETRARLIEARRKRPAVVPEANTPEARRKRSETMRRRWAELKAQGKTWPGR